MGGDDKYKNLKLVLKEVHILIHAKQEDTVKKYLNLLNLNSEQKNKLNKLREAASCEAI